MMSLLPKTTSGRWLALFGGICAAAVVAVLVLLAAFGGLAESDLPGPGIALMLGGIVFTCGLGIGLMALIFYSARTGRDETVYHVEQSRERSKTQQRL